jgi:hypothetical protein
MKQVAARAIDTSERIRQAERISEPLGDIADASGADAP